MIRELRDLHRIFSSREITMRLEREVNLGGHAGRDCVEAPGYPIARLLALRAGLNPVGKNTNQRSTQFCREFCMGQRDPYLISSLARIRRMKRARSVNTTDLDLPVLYICLRPRELRRRELRATE